ncbi:MAG: hypothetical protein ABUL72_00020, partial [Armatimonadota bacterium]
MRINVDYLRVAVLAVVVVWGLAGCSSQPEATPGDPGKKAEGKADDKKVKIAFLVKQPEEPWFQLEWKFADQAAEKDGFELIKIGVPESDQVISKIENAVAQGAQGLIICSPDVKLGPAIVAK